MENENEIVNQKPSPPESSVEQNPSPYVYVSTAEGPGRVIAVSTPKLDVPASTAGVSESYTSNPFRK